MRLYVVREAPVSSSGSKILPVVVVALMGVPIWAVPASADDAPAAAAEATAEVAQPAAAPVPAGQTSVDPGPTPDDVLRPDLTVVVGGPESGWAGGEGAYTMTVRNAAAATKAASGFTVSYVPPDGQTIQSVDSPADADWACALSTEVSCTWFGDLEPGGQTAPVTVIVGNGRRAAGTLTGRVRVSAADDEVHLADNARSVSTTMERPELAVAVGAPESVAPGAAVRMVLAVTNTGPGWASDFSVVGALPDGMQVSSVAGDGFDCDPAARSCTYTDVLAPGLSASVAVEGVLAASYTGGPLTTTARLGHGGTTASAVTAVTALPPVSRPVTPPVTAPVAPATPVTAAPVRQPARVTPVAQQRPTRVTAPARTSSSTATATSTTSAPADQAADTVTPDTLAFTGSRSEDGLAAGVGMVLGGLLLTRVGRRRRTA